MQTSRLSSIDTGSAAMASAVAELVDALEVLPRVCQQLAVARVVERLDADDTSSDVGMPRADVPLECDLGGTGTRDQNLTHVVEMLGHFVEEVEIVGRVARTGYPRLAVDLPMWALTVDLDRLALAEGEPDHSGVQMVEPDDGVDVGHVVSSVFLSSRFNDAPTFDRGIEDKGSACLSVDQSCEAAITITIGTLDP